MSVQKWVDRGFNAMECESSGYNTGARFYKMSDMVEYIKKNKIKKEWVHVNSLYCDVRRKHMNPIQLAEHYLRVKKAKFKYPIIIHYDGNIVDGNHRLAKALIKKKKRLRAYRIDVNHIKSTPM